MSTVKRLLALLFASSSLFAGPILTEDFFACQFSSPEVATCLGKSIIMYPEALWDEQFGYPADRIYVFSSDPSKFFYPNALTAGAFYDLEADGDEFSLVDFRVQEVSGVAPEYMPGTAPRSAPEPNAMLSVGLALVTLAAGVKRLRRARSALAHGWR